MILISGGGNWHETTEIDEYFFKNLVIKNVLFNPVAKETDEVGYSKCYEWIKEKVSRLNLGEFEVLLQTDFSKFKDYSEISSIYIGGGNTYKLLKLINDSKFFDFLLVYLKNGGSVYGASAGAVIFGKSISTYVEENIYGYSEVKGLDLVGGYSIRCHYLDTDLDNIFNFIKRENLPVIGLPLGTALIINEVGMTVLGSGVVKVFEIDFSCKHLFPKETMLFKK